GARYFLDGGAPSAGFGTVAPCMAARPAFCNSRVWMVMRRTLRFMFSQVSTDLSSAMRLSSSLPAVADAFNAAIGSPIGPQRVFRNSSGSGGWLIAATLGYQV